MTELHTCGAFCILFSFEELFYHFKKSIFYLNYVSVSIKNEFVTVLLLFHIQISISIFSNVNLSIPTKTSFVTTLVHTTPSRYIISSVQVKGPVGNS